MIFVIAMKRSRHWRSAVLLVLLLGLSSTAGAKSLRRAVFPEGRRVESGVLLPEPRWHHQLTSLVTRPVELFGAAVPTAFRLEDNALAGGAVRLVPDHPEAIRLRVDGRELALAEVHGHFAQGGLPTEHGLGEVHTNAEIHVVFKGDGRAVALAKLLRIGDPASREEWHASDGMARWISALSMRRSEARDLALDKLGLTGGGFAYLGSFTTGGFEPMDWIVSTTTGLLRPSHVDAATSTMMPVKPRKNGQIPPPVRPVQVVAAR